MDSKIPDDHKPGQQLPLTFAAPQKMEAVFMSSIASTAAVFAPGVRAAGSFVLQVGDNIEIHDDVKIKIVAAVESSIVRDDIKLVHPPNSAEYLLYLILPINDYEPFLGDLEEKFHKEYLPKFGPRRAARLYRRQAIGFLASTIYNRIVAIWPYVRKLGIRTTLVKLAYDLYRHFLSVGRGSCIHTATCSIHSFQTVTL